MGFESSARFDAVASKLRLTTPRGIRSQIIQSPSRLNFRDPGSRPVVLDGCPLRPSNPSRQLQKPQNQRHALVLGCLCAERDSNPRRPKPPRLQRGVIDRSTIDAFIQCLHSHLTTCVNQRRHMPLPSTHLFFLPMAEHGDSSKVRPFPQESQYKNRPAHKGAGRWGSGRTQLKPSMNFSTSAGVFHCPDMSIMLPSSRATWFCVSACLLMSETIEAHAPGIPSDLRAATARSLHHFR